MRGHVYRGIHAALILVIAIVVAGPFPLDALARPHVGGSHHDSTPAACVCAAAEVTHGWCEACGVGYVASLRIPSALLYELLDPHGHDVDLSAVSCNTCHAAMAANEYCETHAIGYSEGRAYVTRLSYLLARGEPVRDTPDHLRLQAALELLDTCEFCALASFANGRCPKCNIHYRDGVKTTVTTERESP